MEGLTERRRDDFLEGWAASLKSQPSAFSLSIADTSSGSFISSPRRPSVHESGDLR